MQERNRRFVPTSRQFLLVALALLFFIPTIAAETNSSSLTGDAVIDANWKLPVFIVLGVIGLVMVVAGFSGEQLLGIIGAVVLFILALGIMNGNLAYKSGEISYHNDTLNATVTEDTYEFWDYGNYELVGWLLAIVTFIMFVLFLMGGDISGF